MKRLLMIALFPMIAGLCGCAALLPDVGSGFDCRATREACTQYQRTGGSPAGYLPYSGRELRVPDQDFTVIHSNRGPVTIYRKGNTYWVNDRRR